MVFSQGSGISIVLRNEGVEPQVTGLARAIVGTSKQSDVAMDYVEMVVHDS